MDPTKKTMRHFYCRDVLWETFEGMATDFDCSVDYLVNEAMRLYARSKNYQVPGGGGPQSQIMPASGMPVRPGTGSNLPAASASRTGSSSGYHPPVTPSAQVLNPRQPTPVPGSGLLPPSSASSSRSSHVTPPLPPGPRITPPTGTSASSPPPSSWSPPIPVGQAAAGAGPAPPLYLVFNGQRHIVDKEQFVIGRGSKTADLAIKDGNISRKHAVVLRRGGAYFIKDLGSTNGIEYKGMRIDNKRIDEGDAFTICDYEITFTFQT
jgi:hypothetical protein